ncbi:hypothetical protein [Cellulomonas sp. WB94]|uniref:hypothetical protein n=1 Tax=Cellulomonas sp. WB94 TaxID=2173174 RepID=UPI0011B214A5|nr:hypothetical protein [Cellulomonas sp. WB94]
MDPMDGEGYRAATRAALDEPAWVRALAEGATWDLPAACAHVEQLATDTALEHDRRGTSI